MLPLPMSRAGWAAVGVMIILIGCALVVGLTRHKLARCRAELAEYRHAYESLAQSIQRQNEQVRAWEQKAAEAGQRATKARTEAAGAVDVATRSADALARAMGAPRQASECLAADGIAVVRADLVR